jgi:N6-L-threonylcarbamoyladenine synthase
LGGRAEPRLFLGLDTSAYTTALALVDEAENLIWEKRVILPVREGALGMRQSEAVFAHLQNLPRLWEEGARELKNASLAAVAASTRPRPVEGSYMPVFKVSEAFGTLIAQTLSLKFLPSSHQEGHLTAGLWSAGLQPGRYLVVHLSGGTTDILDVTEAPPGTLSILRLGGGADLNAGQFVDRIGVAMGLSFPAGPELERLAGDGQGEEITLTAAVKGTDVSFSGPESQARRLLEQGCGRAELARAVERCIADSLVRALAAAAEPGRYRAVLVVGGVAANAFIRARLQAGLAEALPGLAPVFAAARFSGDNAVGTAVQAARQFQKRAGSG